MDEKTCENCKYFCCYYVKVNAHIRRAGVGHCICPELSRKRNKDRKALDAGCEFWAADDREEKRRELIKEALWQTVKRIEEIAAIMEEERAEK
ncbi:MAG: hypothetical protein K2L87_02090 [Clostridiales bacterium]|nr:hypothetical protein [Clostridiales bacterium]